MKKRLDGNDTLYHILKKDLLRGDDTFSKELVTRLIVGLSIWLPVKVYQRIPIMLPYVVRAKGVTAKKWGECNKDGFFKDGNALLRRFINPLSFRYNSVFGVKKLFLGQHFVACHVWQQLKGNYKQNSAYYHQIFSFVPNLVLLPQQVAKLTDSEGYYAQALLKSLAYKIYYNRRVKNRDWGRKNCWQWLNDPKIAEEIDISKLNYFDVTDEWIDQRVNDLLEDIAAIRSVARGTQSPIQSILKCDKYLKTLQNLSLKKREKLIAWLDQYSATCLGQHSKGS